MRPLPYRHRLLSALLALLVLAASVGLTAERHRCRITGRSTVALSLPGIGLPEASVPCGKQRRSGCCDVSHLQHKLNVQTPAASLTKWLPGAPPALSPALLPAPAWAGPGDTGARAPAVAVGAAANSSPPGAPRAGRALLTLGCTLVV